MARRRPTEPLRLESGSLLDDRYLLIDSISEDSWTGTDTLLDRPVEIRFAADLTPAEGQRLAEFAAAAGSVVDARWLRLLDVGEIGDSATSWFVVENPQLPTISTLASAGGMPVDEVIALAISATEALEGTPATMRAGQLRADRIRVDPAGNIRLDGLDIFAARTEQTASEREEVEALGAAIYTALTGRPASPASTSPRRLRGGIPRSLDAITSDAISGVIPTLSGLRRRLAELPRRQPRDDGPSRNAILLRRIVTHALPPVLIAVLGLAAWTVGSNLGAIPGADRPNAVSTFTPEPVSQQLVWTSPPPISVFGGTDDQQGAALAVDGTQATAWLTNTYRSADFDGIRPGLGLLIHLKQPKSVTTIRIRLTIPGATVAIREGDTKPTLSSDLRYVARVVHSPTRNVRFTIPKGIKAHYWLVWLTALPASSNGYSEGIAQIALLH